MISITTLRGCESIPPAFESLFAPTESGAIYRTRRWLEAFARSGIEAGARFRLYAIFEDGAPLALLPGAVSRLYRAHPRARVLHLGYTGAGPYLPLVRLGTVDFAPVLYALIECIRQEARAIDVLRVSPLDPQSVFTRHLQLNLRRRKYPYQVFRHLDDRFETTVGVSSEAYLAARGPGVVDSFLRKTDPFFMTGRAGFRLITEAAHVDSALAAYASVLDVNPNERQLEPEAWANDIFRVASVAGALRFGVIDFDGEPAAVQIWIVAEGVARCLRIWNDPAHRTLPLDEALLVRMLPQLLDVDHVDELDFGPIQVSFAETWAPKKREHVGIVAFNPRTWRGMKGRLRHLVLPKLMATPRRLRRKMLGREA